MEGLRSFIHKIKNIHKLLVFVGDGSNGDADLSNEVWGFRPLFTYRWEKESRQETG